MAIGNFDGLHLAHRGILRELTQTAKAKGLTSALMCFSPHPVEFFKKIQVLRLLSHIGFIRGVEALGIDEVIFQTFDFKFSEISPQDFVQKILIEKLFVKHLIVGNDFRFGKDRLGDVSSLQNLFANSAVSFSSVPIMKDLNGIKIGSRLIRQSLECGDIESANNMLGRSYSIVGSLVRRKGNGTRIGFPTINLQLNEALQIPKPGVYCGDVLVEGSKSDCFILKRIEGMHSVFNIGYRPTIEGNNDELTIEAHVYDSRGFDLDSLRLGTSVAFIVMHRIRDEKRFCDLAQLKSQIHSDIENARDYRKGQK